jgi:Leucine-rich repeat (LRR) protein
MPSSRIRTPPTPPENLDEARRRIAKCIENRDESLDLRSLNLRHIPEEVGELTRLTELSVVHNWIAEIPDLIGRLTELRKLHLELNPIRVLPATLSQLTKLTSLYITAGAPSAASPVIGTLGSLRILVLRGIGLNEFPNWILGLKSDSSKRKTRQVKQRSRRRLARSYQATR